MSKDSDAFNADRDRRNLVEFAKRMKAQAKRDQKAFQQKWAKTPEYKALLKDSEFVEAKKQWKHADTATRELLAQRIRMLQWDYRVGIELEKAQPDSNVRMFDKETSAVLWVLSRSRRLLTRPEISAATGDYPPFKGSTIGSKTVGIKLNNLEKRGFVIRPGGPNSGWALTDAGKKLPEATVE